MHATVDDSDDPDYDIPLTLLARQLHDAGSTFTEQEVIACVKVNEQPDTATTLNEQEIAQHVMRKGEVDEEVDEEEDTYPRPNEMHPVPASVAE